MTTGTKIYQVDGVHGSTLVRAKTKAGAIKATMRTIRENAVAELATPDAIYAAGQRGAAIIGATQEETSHGE